MAKAPTHKRSRPSAAASRASAVARPGDTPQAEQDARALAAAYLDLWQNNLLALATVDPSEMARLPAGKPK